VYLPYLNTTQISVKSQVFEGFFGKLLFRIVNYLSDLTRKYEQASRFFKAWAGVIAVLWTALFF